MSDAAKVIPTTCWECSTHCGAFATVTDGRAVKIAPNPDHPSSKGAFCIKGLRGLQGLTYHPDRVLHPLRRTGARGEGKWERISWDEALDEIFARFSAVRAEHGPLALAGAVSNATFSRGVALTQTLRAFGSPNLMINQDLCGGGRAVSDMVTGLSIQKGEDIDNANCALVVGRNPYAADPSEWMALKRIKAKGARIVVIDPAETPAAKIADLWLQPRPGTDAAIALAMIHVLIAEDLYDRTFVEQWCHGFDALAERAAEYTPARASELSGVAADDIVRAARLYADGPSCFVSGHGIDAFTAAVQTFRALHALVAISGNLDRPGGNLRVKKPKGFSTYLDIQKRAELRLPRELEEQTLGAERFPLWAGPDSWQNVCHNPTAIEAMLTGKPYPLRALHVSGVNIVVTYPDTRRTIAALKSLDFLSVATHMMTPTAEYADIVLPKTTGLEEEDVTLESGGACIGMIQPVGPVQGEARDDFVIARGLVDRLVAAGDNAAGRFFPWADKRAFNETLLGDSGFTLEELRKTGFATFPRKFGNFAEAGFRTPTGKVELYSTRLEKLGLDPLPAHTPPRAARADDAARTDWPFVLLTGAREKSYHHSRQREQDWARKVSPDPWVQLHPDTAAAANVAEGDWIRVQTPDTDAGCRLKATITDQVAPGVLRTGMGWWYPEAAGPERGALDVNINGALSYGAPWDPVTGAPDTRGLLCRIEAA
jgi:thiosulfate reductase/polysulfide reductase chain A